MITAVVTSDNHLGVYYARLRPERLEERRRALQHAFECVVESALERRADLFLHAGDLFDRPDPRNAERLFVARQVHRLNAAGIPVFAITGNHDSPRSYGYDGGIAPQEEMAALGAIRLFRNTDGLQAESVTVQGQQVCIRGMSSDFNRPNEVCPLEDITPEPQPPDAIDIVLLHYGVEGWARADVQEPTLALANLDRLGAGVICVGHLHERQQMRLPGGAVLLNPGATEHIHFGEENLECGFWVLRLEPGHVETEYVPLTPQPMRTVRMEVPAMPATAGSAPAEDADAPGATPTETLLAELETISDARQLLRVWLGGRVPRERFQELDLVALQTQGNESNFYCQLELDDLRVCDQADDQLISYGVSFDAGTELQHTTQALLATYGDDAQEHELCWLAGQQIALSYERLTKGAR